MTLGKLPSRSFFRWGQCQAEVTHPYSRSILEMGALETFYPRVARNVLWSMLIHVGLLLCFSLPGDRGLSRSEHVRG